MVTFDDTVMSRYVSLMARLCINLKSFEKTAAHSLHETN